MTKSKLLLAGLLALMLAPVAAFAQALPDLGGKKVVVVTKTPIRRCSSSMPRRENRSAGNMMR